MSQTHTTTYTLYYKTGTDTTHLEDFATLREASYRKDEIDNDPRTWGSTILTPSDDDR